MDNILLSLQPSIFIVVMTVISSDTTDEHNIIIYNMSIPPNNILWRLSRSYPKFLYLCFESVGKLPFLVATSPPSPFKPTAHWLRERTWGGNVFEPPCTIVSHLRIYIQVGTYYLCPIRIGISGITLFKCTVLSHNYVILVFSGLLY